MAEREYLEGITHGFMGARLKGWQLAQRGYLAGFTDAKELAVFIAVMRAESGGYLMAFHHNVERDEGGKIVRYPDDELEYMKVRSTDMGLIQRNVVHPEPVMVGIDVTEVSNFVADLFARHPKLANGQESAKIARELYEARGWQPWFAHSNDSYLRGLPAAPVAIANFLDKVLNRASGSAIVRP